MACCDVLSGPFSSLLLFAASLYSLHFKYQADTDGRTREQVLFDFTKIVAGAMWAGVMTTVCCGLLGSVARAGDECGWYAVEIMLDTSLGMWAALWTLRLAVWWLKRILGEQKARQLSCGRYRSKTGAFVKVVYAQQVTLWLLIISVSKLAVAALVFSQAFQLQLFARFLLAPAFRVPLLGYLLMAAFRVAAQSAQLWLADAIFVRAKDFTTADPFEEVSQKLPLLEEGCYVPPVDPKAAGGGASRSPEAAAEEAKPAQEPSDGGFGELMAALEADPDFLMQALERLPVDFANEINGEAFELRCLDGFLQKMDEDGSDLEPVELFTVVCDLLKSQDLEISYEQYAGLFSCFDRERSGMVSQASFLDFARYVAVMARLGACQEAAEARMPSGGGGDESTLEAAEVEEPPCEEDIQRRLDAARAQLEEALRETATQDDIDEARLRVQMDEERLQRARQEFEDLRSKVKAEEETGRPSRVSSNPSNGEVKHYEEDRQGGAAAAPQKKKGCFPACGRK